MLKVRISGNFAPWAPHSPYLHPDPGSLCFVWAPPGPGVQEVSKSRGEGLQAGWRQMSQWGRGAIPAGFCLGQKSNTDSHTHRDSSVVRGFHTGPVYLQPVCEEGGK